MRLRKSQSGTLTPEITDEAWIVLRRVGLANEPSPHTWATKDRFELWAKAR